jgi:hypothetical protein
VVSKRSRSKTTVSTRILNLEAEVGKEQRKSRGSSTAEDTSPAQRGSVSTEDLGIVNKISSDNVLELDAPGGVVLGTQYVSTTVVGTVVGISSNGVTVIVEGASATALNSNFMQYRPAVGDTVSIQKAGDSLVITGKITPRGYIEQNLESVLATNYTRYQPEESGWFSGNGAWGTPRARKTASGVVVLSGMVAKAGGAAIAAGEVMLTLPVEFRPDYNEIYPVMTNVNAQAQVLVGTDGTVRVFSGNGGWVSLCGIQFLKGGTWTNATLLNSFTAQTGIFSGYTGPVPGYALDADGLVWIRGSLQRTALPADNTPIFNLPVGLGPRTNYQHHIPAVHQSGHAGLGVGTQGALTRNVQFKIHNQTVAPSRYGMGGAVFVSESFTGKDRVLDGAPVYNDITGWRPRYGITPDGFVVSSGLTSTVGGNFAIGRTMPDERIKEKNLFNGYTSGNGYHRIDVQPNGMIVSATTANTWASVEVRYIADQIAAPSI